MSKKIHVWHVIAVIAVGVMLGNIATSMFQIREARANAAQAAALSQAVHEAVTEASAGSAPSWNWVVTTTTARVGGAMPDGFKYQAVRCWVNSATPVLFGNADTDESENDAVVDGGVTPDGGPVGYKLCTDTADCETAAMTWNTRNLWARVGDADSAVIIECTTVK